MTTVVVSILVVIFALIVGVSYLNMQEVKKQKEKVRLLNNKVRQIQAVFKDKVKPLSTQDLITVRQKQKLNAIANNYFVFQTVSVESIKSFASLTEQVSALISTTLEIAFEDENEVVKDLLDTLTSKLPESATDCTSEFYLGILPSILSRYESELNLIKNRLESERNSEQEEEVAIDNTVEEESLDEQPQIANSHVHS